MQRGLFGYTELDALGAGSYGRVVLARHDPSGTIVAIKYLYQQHLHDPVLRAQFRGEAAIMRRVADPHVARLYEYVEGPEDAAIVMEAVPGVALSQVLLEDGALTPEAALAVLKGSLLGLAAAHQAGTVHRDYKPGNVLVQPNRQSKLVDFGIAVLAGQAGAAAGTPNYMAPEQWYGAPATPATDVYAATCVFFRCITGRPPFEDGERGTLREQHEAAPIPVDAVPGQLRGLLVHGMAKHPSARPVGAAAFVAELEAVAAAGYGPNWESRGWERLAGQAAVLLAATPLAALGTTAAAGVAGGVTGGVASAGAGLGAGSAAASTVTSATSATSAAAAGAGASAGGGVGTAVATKVAIGVVAAAAVAGATIVVINSTGDSDPSAASGVSASVQQANQTYTNPDFTFNGQVVRVSGIADQNKTDRINAVLAEPISSWAEYTKAGLSDGGTVPPDHPVAYSTATITRQDQKVLSVRYDMRNDGVGDAFGNHGAGAWLTVTVDLTTGAPLRTADVFAATPDGAAAVDQLITRNSPDGLCRSPDQQRQPLTAADITGQEAGWARPVQLLFTPDAVQFVLYAPRFGYAMACEYQVVSVPLDQAVPLMNTRVAGLVAPTGPTGTQPVAFGRFTLTVPRDWAKLSTSDGDTYLRSAPQCRNNKVESCPGFLVSDNTNPKGTPYELGKPFNRAGGPRHCDAAGRGDGVQQHATLLDHGLRQIGSKKANYEEWQITCSDSTGFALLHQRVWYLPVSKVVFVDEWDTPGVDDILAKATWS